MLIWYIIITLYMFLITDSEKQTIEWGLNTFWIHCMCDLFPSIKSPARLFSGGAQVAARTCLLRVTLPDPASERGPHQTWAEWRTSCSCVCSCVCGAHLSNSHPPLRVGAEMSAPVGCHSFIYPGDMPIRHRRYCCSGGALLKISSCCSLYVSVCVSVSEGN